MKRQTFLEYAKFCIDKHQKNNYIDTYFCSFPYDRRQYFAVNISDRVYAGYRKRCCTHSESRLVKNHDCKKLIVIRTRKAAPQLLLAKPCPLCQTFLKNKKIQTVYYSIDNDTYGIYYPQKNQNIIKNFRG